MQLDYAFFAKIGTINKGGTFSALEAGIDRITLAKIPGTIPQLAVVLRVLFDEIDDTEHTLHLQVKTPDGKDLTPSAISFTNQAPTQEDPSPKASILCVALNEMPVKVPGMHEVRLLVDGNLVKSLSLHLVEEVSTRK